jgi:hypothetical protein
LKAGVYIDGFNLYYGALVDKPKYKWLDLEAYFRKQLLPGQTLDRIRYFTAPVKPRSEDPDQPARQAAYLDALGTLSSVSIHRGQFKIRQHNLPEVGTGRMVRVTRPEEKGSDVNLATYLLMDSFRAEIDVALVVTDDFDLLEPLRCVRREFGISVGISSPRNRRALSRAVGASFYKPVRAADFASCQLPATVTGPKGAIHRPRRWS